MNWPDFILVFVVGAFVGLLIGLLAGALMALASEFDHRAQVRRRLMNGDYVKPADNAQKVNGVLDKKSALPHWGRGIG